MKAFIVNGVVKISFRFLPWFLSKRNGTCPSGELFIRYCPSSEMCISRCSGAYLLNSTGDVESFGQEMPTSGLAKRALILYRWSRQKPFFESLCEKHGRQYSLCISLSQVRTEYTNLSAWHGKWLECLNCWGEILSLLNIVGMPLLTLTSIKVWENDHGLRISSWELRQFEPMKSTQNLARIARIAVQYPLNVSVTQGDWDMRWRKSLSA